MSELPDLDDAMFKLATGEEFVLPADTPPAAASASPNGGAPQQVSPPVLRRSVLVRSLGRLRRKRTAGVFVPARSVDSSAMSSRGRCSKSR